MHARPLVEKKNAAIQASSVNCYYAKVIVKLHYKMHFSDKQKYIHKKQPYI